MVVDGLNWLLEHKMILDGLNHKSIGVDGDLIVDYYRIIKPKRLSPEAPIMIGSPETYEYRVGGAANVANNIKELGSKVALYGVTGDDWKDFVSLCKLDLEAKEIFSKVLCRKDKKTTMKERIITKRQQLLRIDHQDTTPLVGTEFYFAQVINNRHDVIVFSDYDHGTMNPFIVKQIMSSNIPIVVNSKSKDALQKYYGANVAIFNMGEAQDIVKENLEPEELAVKIRSIMECDTVIITMGPNGIYVMNNAISKVFSALDKEDKEVIDVTGAGDTVTASISAMIALNEDAFSRNNNAKCIAWNSIIEFANIVAGIVIRKRGVAVAERQEIYDMLSKKGV